MPFIFILYHSIEFCLLSNNIQEYHYVSQGKTTIPNVDDAEEMRLTDVSFNSHQENRSVFTFYLDFF
jgi:myosin heavy subunit